MLNQILQSEFKMLSRNGWLGILTILFLFLMGFATYNGHKSVKKRSQAIATAKQELAESDAKMLQTISDIEQGKEVDLPYWQLPTSPSTIGSRHPRVITMDAQPLAFISKGQSDMYAHFTQPSAFENIVTLDYAEMSNPVQLLYGTFDLAFVFIYIFPLLIIAFTYNILSREKELGTLKLIGAQPLSVPKWLMQRLALRFGIFAILSIVVFLIYTAIFAPQAFSNIPQLLMTLLLLVAYELFWFVVAGVVNFKINQSSKNALALIGIWLLIVIVIPATANQLSTSLYPAPSRLQLINEIRESGREIEKQQEKILDSYLRNHPELANTDKKKVNFWHGYFASKEMMESQVEPILSENNESLKKQHQMVSFFKFLSPAILMQDALNKQAGTSAAHYDSYQNQVVSYIKQWRGFLQPLLFENKKFTKADYENRPIFTYQPLHQGITGNLLVLLLLTALVALLGFAWRKTYQYF